MSKISEVSELWGKMENGDEVRDRRSGNIAVKEGNFLLWKKVVDQKHVSELSMGVCMGENRGIVSMADALENEWEIVKEEEKEIESYKWMRKESSIHIIYGSSADGPHSPVDVMCLKSFLRWGGKMHNKGEEWLTDRWCLWFNEKGDYDYRYDPERGYIQQVFAEHAEMRVEKS